MLKDKISGAQSVIGLEEHFTHIGKSFLHTDVTALGAAATKTWVIETPDSDVSIHFGWRLHVHGGMAIDFYEGSTVAADGTVITPVNRNRRSDNTSDIVLREDPTVSADGTLIFTSHIGDGAAASSEADSSKPSDEFILKRNTKYTLRTTSDGASNEAAIRLSWFEIEHY